MSSQSAGLDLLAAVLSEHRLSDFLRFNGEHFKQHEKTAYDFVHDFYNQYGQLPGLDLAIKRKVLKAPDAEAPYGYFADEFSKRTLYMDFDSLLPRVQDVLNKTKDPHKALDLVNAFVERSKGLTANSNAGLTSFGEMGDDVLRYLREFRSRQGLIGIPTGWPTLDEVTGGFQGGEVYAIIATKGMGKSISMTCMADAAHSAGEIPLYLSMEMPKQSSGLRYFALKSRLNYNSLRSAQVSTPAMRHLSQVVNACKSAHPIYFIEGSFKKKINDVVALVQGLRPTIVFIDAAYLLKPSTNYRGVAKWEIMGDIVEDIKEMAMSLNLPVVVSFQFNRSVRGRSTGGDLNDIQLSDSIGQILSVALGLYRNPDEGSTEPKRYLEFLKARDADISSFYINWDWSNMNFSEIPDSTVREGEDI